MRCAVEGCGRDRTTRQWCKKHWTRWWRHGDPTTLLASPHRRCAVSGCDRRHSARGWCDTHYQRWCTHGSTFPEVPVGDLMTYECGHTGAQGGCMECARCDHCGLLECGCCAECGGEADIPGVTRWCRGCFYRVTNERRAAA